MTAPTSAVAALLAADTSPKSYQFAAAVMLDATALARRFGKGVEPNVADFSREHAAHLLAEALSSLLKGSEDDPLATILTAWRKAELEAWRGRNASPNTLYGLASDIDDAAAMLSGRIEALAEWLETEGEE